MATKVLTKSDMVPVIALLGDFSSEYVDVRSVVADFGWDMVLVADFAELSTLAGRSDVAAVIIHARTIGTSWVNALSRVRYLVPQARVLICYGADQAYGRRDMLEKGAYGVLPSPLDSREVRQLLGFVWAAQNRMEPEEAQTNAVGSFQKPNAFAS